MNVVVVGARGQLGAAVVQEFSAAHTVVGLGHEDLDATDERSVAGVMDRLRPDVIINCVAYNDVDGAEDHPVEALNVNAFAVRALAAAAAARRAGLVHYSTDFVFDGTATAPYTELDRPNPRSVYAASKLLGEWFAVDAPEAYVLRVESLFGRAPGARPAKGSVANILSALADGREARVFADRTITPAYVIDIARATRQLLDNRAPAGTYHCVNSGRCTWLEFAQELARQLGVEPRLVPIRMSEMRLRADRPRYCAMANDKLAAAGVPMPTWQDALGRYLAAARDEIAHQVPNR